MSEHNGGGTAQGGYWYARAICESGLPPSARHIAITLAFKADSATGKHVISLSAIAEDTGLGRSTVARQLRVIESAGFVSRRSPKTWQSLGRGEMTEYTLLIPAGYLTKSVPSATAGLPSPRAGLPLVPETHRNSPAAGHTTTGLSSPPPDAGASAGDDGTNSSPPAQEIPNEPQYKECGQEAGYSHIKGCSKYVPRFTCANDECGEEVPAIVDAGLRPCPHCGHKKEKAA